jgi:hypothetical protein
MNGTTPRRVGTDASYYVCSAEPPLIHTPIVDVLTHHAPDNSFSDDKMYPVYLIGEVSPPINGYSLWFTLTVVTPTLKRLLFPNFFDSEMGQRVRRVAFGEEPRDPEHP